MTAFRCELVGHPVRATADRLMGVVSRLRELRGSPRGKDGR